MALEINAQLGVSGQLTGPHMVQAFMHAFDDQAPAFASDNKTPL